MNLPLPHRTPDLVTVLTWIERHLDDPLNVDVIAARASLSPYHFSRLFSARMGRSVMAHVRGRRLIRAAQRLTADLGLRLVDLALDCGFDSQEAFTRAFARVFGVSPGRFRRGFSVTPIEGQYPMTMPDDVAVAVTRLPDLMALDAFTVAGPSARFDEATKAQILQLWSKLMGALPLKGQVPSWTCYGVVPRVVIGRIVPARCSGPSRSGDEEIVLRQRQVRGDRCELNLSRAADAVRIEKQRTGRAVVNNSIIGTGR